MDHGVAMTKLYSKRLLLPYVGVVQVVDLGWARALSLNGITWVVRYLQTENKETRKRNLNYDLRVNMALMLKIENEHMSWQALRRDLDPGQAEIDSQRFFEVIKSAAIPFAPSDSYEYWLLDDEDESPLALLHTCIDENEISFHTPPPVWRSIPSAEMFVRDVVAESKDFYETPVNYRLEQQIEERAGKKPKAVWFKRSEGDSENFPCCLIREQWEDAECQRLCDLYLQRLAPRLLMLSSLPAELRPEFEDAASHHAIEVDNFYKLYPEVVNEKLLTAARVEARLRKVNRV